MTSSSPLERLASMHGVATRYEGSDKIDVEVPDDVVVAVLDRLGVDASSPERVAAALAAGPPTGPRTVAVFVGEPHELTGPIVLEDGSTVDAATTELPPGYHRLASGDHVVVAPARLADVPRTWGWMLQLYALHSSASWGMGDYADLATFAARAAAEQGAGVLLANPLQAFVGG